MARNKRKNRIANTLAVCFWLCAWQAASVCIGQKLILVSPLEVCGALLALLRALLAPADVVVLDEPFKGLDEAARQAAAAYVRRMQAGRTLLCITHEEGDAALLGARVFRLPEAAEQQEGR